MSAADQTGRRPLSGVHVVTIATNVPGPLAAARLTSLGARVTTVLPPAGDALQMAAPRLFDALHEGQTVTTLDLRQDDGRRELEKLLATADLLLTSHRARTLTKLSLDFDATSLRHPQLCQVDIVGHAGEEADVPGHDLTYQASIGLLDPKRMPATLYADLAGAEQAATAALAVLFARGRDGHGSRAEIAIADAAEVLALPLRHGLTGPRGPLGGSYPFYAVYPAADGHVALAAIEPQFNARLLQLLELQDAATDLARLGKALAEIFSTRPADEWEAWARTHDLPLVAVQPSPAPTTP